MSGGQAMSPLSHPLQPQPFATHLFLIQPSTNIHNTHSFSPNPQQTSTTHTLCQTALNKPPPHTLFVTQPFTTRHQYALFVLQPPTPSTIHTLYHIAPHKPRSTRRTLCYKAFLNSAPYTIFVRVLSITFHFTDTLSHSPQQS